MKILVIGGTGNTGQHIVRRLTARGDDVRVLSRHADQQKLQGVELIAGSITDRGAVAWATANMDGIIICVESATDANSTNAPEAVHYHGIVNVVDAVKASNTPIVLVTQIYITRADAHPDISNIINARRLGENALRKSSLPYTIVRPSWLTNESAGRQRLHFEQGDTGEGQVARADVAEVCVQALFDKSARGKTFEVYNAPGTAATELHTLFVNLKLDE